MTSSTEQRPDAVVLASLGGDWTSGGENVYTSVLTNRPLLSRLPFMRVAGIRELRNEMAALLAGDEPILVTKHGKVAGLYLPLDDPDEIPDDIRREVVGVIGRHLDRLLEASGVEEAEIQADFDVDRRRRRRR
jgi:hypothetical protein